MTETLSLLQVLLIRDARVSEQMGEALLAAFKEIELFYNLDTPRVTVRRFFLTPSYPWIPHKRVAVRDPRTGYPVYGMPPSSERTPGRSWERVEVETFANPEQSDALSNPSFWEGAQGRYSRTYNQIALGQQVREILGSEESGRFLMLVTDQEITPPPGWRYIIWDDIPNGAVISMSPTDPRYWREPENHRVATVKHRVRTAGLSVVGCTLGLKRCRNENCFLYDDVDSVSTLDEMLFMGPEHGLSDLERRGFAARPEDPNKVQSIITDPGLLDESGESVGLDAL